MPEPTTSLVAVVSLLALSAFFSSSETAIFSLSAGRPAGRAGRDLADAPNLEGRAGTERAAPPSNHPAGRRHVNV